MNKKQIAIISTISNCLLAALKISIGLIASSTAILASGIDSLSDILSSLLVYIGIKLSEKTASKKHPYGLFRAESIASFIVFLFVLFASLGIIYESITNLFTGEFNTDVNTIALITMFVSALITGLLSYFKIKIGKSQNSTSLVLDGRHSLIDVLTSSAVIIGLLISNTIPIFDSIAGLLIGLYILFETSKMAREVFEGLLDTADIDSENKVKEICMKEEVKISSIKSRKVAGRTFMELEVTLPTDIKIKKADKVISNLQKLILQKIKEIEYVVIQIKGGSKRHTASRNNLKKSSRINGKDLKTVLKKKGFRTIYPYKNGNVIEEAGAPEYLIIDEKDGKTINKKVVKNPFYHIGRSHGVKFARYIKADRIVAINIGENAKKRLKQSGIEVGEE